MRRSKERIVADIIRSTNGKGATKTQIVYRSNLNFKLAQRYLDHLVERGYLRAEQRGRHTIYFATEKGEAFLKRLSEIEREIESMFE
ncbi:winged helix-turn-helix domain-containing protein [Palaeococcus ferrophilus]|uniref:winged helix-turn-helix domain-containing protein n=1 Tax=Palaeococcus ferrophilus TaxID=83868 RepID=UPI00064F4210|nr:winged helix-turn-helix domain-containing protein [Palaeococcus ferrophilus]